MDKASQPVSPLKFFILTYILSWTIWILLIFASPLISEGLSTIVRLFGVLTPAVSAIILTASYSGSKGIRQLFSRLKIWRVGSKWWLITIFVYPLLLIISGLLYNLFNTQSAIDILSLDVGILVANIIFLSLASLGEEVGWRGVALPALLRRYSPFLSSLILGFYGLFGTYLFGF